MRPQCAHEAKLQQPDPPPLKGTLEFHQPAVATSENIATFIRELSLVPSYLSTIVFRERLDIPEVVNKLLMASRRTLTKLTFGHNSKTSFRYRNRDCWFTDPAFTFLAIPEGINLGALKVLELSTFAVKVLPSVLCTVKPGTLETVRFFLVHQLEDEVEHQIRRSWLQFDLELYALGDRVEAAQRYGCGDLQVKFVDFYPTTPVSTIEEIAMLFLPGSYQHAYLSFSVG